jgi:ribonuclease P protein component
VIEKITMLNNEYGIIKDTLFQDIEKIKQWKLYQTF